MTIPPTSLFQQEEMPTFFSPKWRCRGLNPGGIPPLGGGANNLKIDTKLVSTGSWQPKNILKDCNISSNFQNSSKFCDKIHQDQAKQIMLSWISKISLTILFLDKLIFKRTARFNLEQLPISCENQRRPFVIISYPKTTLARDAY